MAQFSFLRREEGKKRSGGGNEKNRAEKNEYTYEDYCILFHKARKCRENPDFRFLRQDKRNQEIG
ncbi:MAG: hypothetical protein WCI71_08470, partial [Bacteroidota bacterium]